MQKSYIENIRMSNKFNPSSPFIKEIGGINTKLNRKIAGLVNPVELSYFNNIDQIISMLRDKILISYQEKLIEAQIQQLSLEKLDIDKCEICLKVPDALMDKVFFSDYQSIGKEKSSFEFVSIKGRRDRLSVSHSRSIGTINKGFNKKSNRSFYTKKYKIILDGDDYRSVEIYVGEKQHRNNKTRSGIEYNVEIHFIPTRFTIEQISLIFSHIKSKFGTRQYKQVIENARVRRLDTGFMFHGVSQLYGFLYTNENKYKYGDSYPDYDNTPQETSYIGSLKNSNIVAYEKVLKEFKFFATYKGSSISGHDYSDLAANIKGLQEWYNSRVSTFRVEARHYSKPFFKLTQLSSINNRLGNVLILKPRYLSLLKDDELRALINDKSLYKRVQMLSLIRSRGHLVDSDLFYFFDKRKLKKSHVKLLRQFVKVILEPANYFDAPFIEYNYSEQALKCKNYLKRIAAKRVIENPIDISFHNDKIVYIEGCAGAGKTTLISDQIEKININRSCKVLVWTFTNKSKDDISEGITRRFKEVYSSNIEITTISSWCSQNLMKTGKIVGKVIDQDESIKIISKLFYDCLPEFESLKKRKSFKKVTPESIYSVISHMRNFESPMLDDSIKKVNEHLLPFSKLIEHVYLKYEDFKKANLRQDFDGLIELVSNKLKSVTNMKRFMGSVQYLFVDEVQDLNSRQWDILRSISQFGIKIMVVGDPAQSMYQFRGATPQKLYNQDLQIYKLVINYRSTTQICAVTNEYRKMISNRLKSAYSNKREGDLPRLKVEDDINDAIKWIACDIKQRNIQKDDVFVLCRFNSQREMVELQFEKTFGKKHRYKIMTFHASKGLQARTVYVLDPRFKWMGFTNGDEELCNMYVALSRAEENLIIVKSGTAVISDTDRQYKKRNLLDYLDDTYFQIE